MSDWIKVSERLPEMIGPTPEDDNWSRPVLIIGKKWKNPLVGYTAYDIPDPLHKTKERPQWMSCSGDGSSEQELNRVTHWMPLPAPPED